MRGRFINSGYVRVKVQYQHPRADKDGFVAEHILIAEAALGHWLVEPAEVHHFNQDRTDNLNSNLVICEDHSYHFLLHMRQRAMAECGDPNFLRCRYCKTLDAPSNLAVYTKRRGLRAYHLKCKNAYQVKWCARKKAAEDAQRGYSIKQIDNRVKTACNHGHEFTPENTYVQIRDGLAHRGCRKCAVLKTAKYRTKLRTLGVKTMSDARSGTCLPSREEKKSEAQR